MYLSSSSLDDVYDMVGTLIDFGTEVGDRVLGDGSSQAEAQVTSLLAPPPPTWDMESKLISRQNHFPEHAEEMAMASLFDRAMRAVDSRTGLYITIGCVYTRSLFGCGD